MDLTTRSSQIERMDDADVPADVYHRCLSDLAQVNRITLTHRATLNWLDGVTRNWRRGRMITVVDVACGYGDLLRTIAGWARVRGLVAKLSGVDLNPRAVEQARDASRKAVGQWEFITSDVFAYRPATPPDFIVTSQFTHHLSDLDVVRFIRWMEENATIGWMISDLQRHWFSYLGFRWLARLARWHEIVRNDGTISIARSFTIKEWKERLLAANLIPDHDAQVYWQFPFRIAVTRLRPVGKV